MGEIIELHHRKLETNWGCMYHALYAFTGDERLLDEQLLCDVNESRWRLRVLEAGFLLIPWYVHPHEVCSPLVWRELEEKARFGGRVGFVVAVPSQVLDAERHQVAILLEEGTFKVSDSSREGLLEYDGIDKFLESHYARAFDIEMLSEARLEAHTRQEAEEFLQRGKT